MGKNTTPRACTGCGKVEPISGKAGGFCVACRIAAKVEKTETCWVWTGARMGHGYGLLSVNNKRLLVHRVVYEMHHGPIPEGLEIDHICWNRSCVNPDHLRLVDRSQNQQNVAGARTDSKTGMRGVTWSKSHGNWCAEVCHRGVRHRSHHATLEEANAAAVALRNQLFTHNDADR